MARKLKRMPLLPDTEIGITSQGSIDHLGRMRSAHDNTVWLLRQVPMNSMSGATLEKAKETIRPLNKAAAELAKMVQSSGVGVRRQTMAGSYREFKLITINIEEQLRADRGHVLAETINRRHGHRSTYGRVCLFAVKLRDKMTAGGRSLFDIVDSIVNYARNGIIPMADFDYDTKLVSRAMDAAGMVPVSGVGLGNAANIIGSWWNQGTTPACYIRSHSDHLHVFRNPQAMREARLLGSEACHLLGELPGQAAITMATIQRFKWANNFTDGPFDSYSHWIERLLHDEAMCVALTGRLEPGRITAKELEVRKGQLENDAKDRSKANVRQGADKDAAMERTLAILDRFEERADSNMSPTVTNASVTIGFNGMYSHEDLEDMSQDRPYQLVPFAEQQAAALASTWLGSTITPQRTLHEFPVQVMAASGANSLEQVGDSDGALFGLTEHDRQMSYLSPTAASDEDYLPLAVFVGNTGIGKTMTMLNLCEQFAQMLKPGVVFDFKQGSDHSELVESWGRTDYPATVIDLSREDQLSRGTVDPIIISHNAPNADKADASGVMLAGTIITSLGLFGDPSEREPIINEALRRGVRQGGARSSGSALLWAAENSENELVKETVERILSAADADPTIGALIGFDADGDATITIGTGVTLVMAGSRALNLPDLGMPPKNAQERIDSTFLRMVVLAATMSMAGRDGGWLAMDEAWMFLQTDPREVERIGRLARQQNILPMLFTQRAREILEAKINAYISRVFISAMADKDDAIEACELARVDPKLHLGRLTQAKFSSQSGVGGDQKILNRESLYPLKNDAGEVTRGALWLSVDMAQRAGYVEAIIDADFLFRASTNPNDRRKRREMKEKLLADRELQKLGS